MTESFVQNMKNEALLYEQMRGCLSDIDSAYRISATDANQLNVSTFKVRATLSKDFATLSAFQNS